MKELEYPFDSFAILEKRKKLKRLLLSGSDFLTKRIAILSGSTVGDIADILELFLLNNGIQPIFYIGKYNRFYEEAVFENPELEEFKPELIYVYTTNKNIDKLPSASMGQGHSDKLLDIQFTKYQAIWKRLEEQYHCPIIQNNFEMLNYRLSGNSDIYLENGNNGFIHNLNSRFYEYARKNTDFHICDINYLSASIGLDQWSDLTYWYAYKYALSMEAIPTLAQNVANIIKAIFGKNKKALICDLDNTLWGGVLGDDGSANIKLGMETADGMAYSDFQRYLKELKQMGIILTVCSKNEVTAVKEGLNHPSAILKEEDFTVIKANWDEKYKNIEEIINELNLLDSSFVFLDDNPAERESVNAFLPNVETPYLDEVFSYRKVLDRNGFFEAAGFLDEDRNRTEYYKANQARDKYLTEFVDYQEYLSSLSMKSTVYYFNPDNINRVSQLINKTNQFNLTVKRYSLSEVSAISVNSNYVTLCADLEDHFGQNGIVTALIGEVIAEDMMKIDLWIMSCRIFKRGLEYALFDSLVSICQSKKVTKIIGEYINSGKNQIVSQLYQELGFYSIGSSDKTSLWEYQIPNDYQNKNNIIEVLINE